MNIETALHNTGTFAEFKKNLDENDCRAFMAVGITSDGKNFSIAVSPKIPKEVVLSTLQTAIESLKKQR